MHAAIDRQLKGKTCVNLEPRAIEPRPIAQTFSFFKRLRFVSMAFPPRIVVFQWYVLLSRHG
jgi:hypothetical protein